MKTRALQSACLRRLQRITNTCQQQLECCHLFTKGAMMTHKYRGCIVVLSINKSVKPNEEQKVLMSGFDQGFTANTSKRVFRGIWQYK
jgi:hypothetical protein